MELQLSNEENYFISKREEVSNIISLPTKSFLQSSYDFKKISVIKNEPNFVMLIAGWCTQTATLMQVKNPIDYFIKQDIINMLTGYWSILSFEELIKAFELERFGAYKEKTEHYQLFDCNYISQVLKKYQQWKRDNKTELKIEPINEVKEITEIEKKQIMKDAVNKKYNEFLQSNDIEEPFNHIFKELIEIGKIKMPTAETPKLEMYYQKKLEDAKNQILREYGLKTSTDALERNKIKAITQAIINNTDNQDAKAKIEVRAKKLVLIDYFTKQRENGINLIIE
jgi:hypothetical protein